MSLSNVALSALEPRANHRPATYALELRPEQSSREVSTAVIESLAELGPSVAPISPVDHGVLVLQLARRTLEGAEPALAFAAGYALADDFGLRTAEPDLPTPFFPEEDPPPSRTPAELMLRFPPGCWVDPEDGLDARWAVDRIHAPEAWRLSMEQGRPEGGRGVVIAQPDTGIRPHAELVGVPRQGGYDIVDGDPDPTDPLTGLNPGHGTGTASVVVSPVTLQMSGSAPAATHMPIRAITTVVEVSQVSVAAAITRAVDDGAHVISMSLGGLPASVLQRAVSRAVAADVIVLAAAGNCVRTVVWPARYDECLAVAGTNSVDQMWEGTCRGPAVDISAPAQNVFQAETSSPDAVGQGQGTSFAVALTAGVAALWLAHHGRATLLAAARARGETLHGMFRRLLTATARQPAGWDSSQLGAGIVDARALLAAALEPTSNHDPASVHAPPPLHETGFGVAGLVAETIGVDAAEDPHLDWLRHGPELGNALLQAQLAAISSGADGAGDVPAPPRLRLSEALASAIGNPRLRHYLGLDDPSASEVLEVQP